MLYSEKNNMQQLTKWKIQCKLSVITLPLIAGHR